MTARQFSLTAGPQPGLRRAITAAYREDERACVQRLLEQARMAPEEVAATQALARRLVTEVRAKRSGASGVDALMQEFSLSSQEASRSCAWPRRSCASRTGRPRTG